MDAQVTININKPNDGESTIVIPDTGVFSADHSSDLIISHIGSLLAVSLIAPILVAIIIRHYKKRKSSPRKKGIDYNSLTVALILMLSCFTFFLKNQNTSAIGTEDLELSVTAADTTIDVELEDNPIYSASTGTITIDSATEYGYILYAYIEDPDLTTEDSASSSKISGLENSESKAALLDNTWGLSLVEPTDQDSEVFFGLPTDTENPMVLKEVFEATEAGDTTSLYLATLVTPELDYGTYSGAVIHYKAIANPGIYMQNFTKDDCVAKASSEPITVYDRRDNSDYTVRYLNNACWMTQNLRISGIVSAEFSNFEESPYSGSDTINLYAGGEFGNSSGTFTAPMMHLANEFDVDENSGAFTADELGGFYNYCAASAGQICAQGQNNATQDICPSGWRLPTGGGGTSEQQTLINSLGSNIARYTPVSAGGYVGTELYAGIGYYWSSSARSVTNHWDIYFRQGKLIVGNINNDYGISIRCLRTE